MILVWRHRQISIVIGIVKCVVRGVIHPVQNIAKQSKPSKSSVDRTNIMIVTPTPPPVLKHPRKPIRRNPNTNPDLPFPDPASRRKISNN